MDHIRTPRIIDDVIVEKSSIDVNLRYKPTKVEFYFREESYVDDRYQLTFKFGKNIYRTNTVVGRDDIETSLAKVKENLDSGKYDILITSDNPPKAKLEERVDNT
ncbi:MAG: hypothetical protein AABW52_02760, partial [Nanoarchaeota archaeon]